MADTDNDLLLLMMGRLGYGPRPEDAATPVQPLAWLEEQLFSNPADPELDARIAKATLQIKYNAGPKWPAADEMRPLNCLSAPSEQLWKLLDNKQPRNGAERARPRDETVAATLLRAVYAKYQLREVMAQFWHDHFSVNAYSDDHIGVMMPVYDRDVIRKHCLGNFRQMLEAVATSAAMQYYLSNHSSRAGAANENYGRELFELHTLGRDAYLNDRYDRWKDVPGAQFGKPEGYIDEDVYEAARSFTGWTIEDGSKIDNQRSLPATGKFTYVEKWHDGYQKRVLATDFQPFAAAMSDGRMVLDLVAAHPATAYHLAGKLCMRIIGPGASPALLKKTADAWLKLRFADDQVAQVVRMIAESDEFRSSAGAKVKRPLALMASFVRATGMDFMPTNGLANQLAGAGQRLFGALTPAGLADDNELFLNSNAMRQRWQMLLGLARNAWANGVLDAQAGLVRWGRKAAGPDEAIAQWISIFGGGAVNDRLAQAIMDGSGVVGFSGNGDDNRQLALAAATAALAPPFQVV